MKNFADRDIEIHRQKGVCASLPMASDLLLKASGVSMEPSFKISYSADPRNVERADAAAVAIVKRLQTAPLPLVELQRGKAPLLAQRVLPLDSYDGIAAEFLAGAGEGYYTGGSDRWFWKALLDTTPAQLQHAMRRIDARRFLRVIVAPGT